jgi:hypothetical protein
VGWRRTIERRRERQNAVTVIMSEAEEVDFEDDSAFHPEVDSSVAMVTSDAGHSVTSSFSSFEEANGGGGALRLDSQSSIVDGLLTEIYYRWHFHPVDSDTWTESSVISDGFCGHRSDCSISNVHVGGYEQNHAARLHRAFLETKGQQTNNPNFLLCNHLHLHGFNYGTTPVLLTYNLHKLNATSMLLLVSTRAITHAY